MIVCHGDLGAGRGSSQSQVTSFSRCESPMGRVLVAGPYGQGVACDQNNLWSPFVIVTKINRVILRAST